MGKCEGHHSARGSRLYAHAKFEKNACKMVWRLYGRESIFLFSHTNEFCGKSKVAHEPVLAWDPLKDPRWVYERGAKDPEGDGRVQPSPLRQRTRSCMQPLRTPLNKLAGTRLASGGVIVVASPLTSLTGSPGAAADGGDSGRPQQGLCGFLAAGQASH